jgi:hypothetical protein
MSNWAICGSGIRRAPYAYISMHGPPSTRTRSDTAAEAQRPASALYAGHLFLALNAWFMARLSNQSSSTDWTMDDGSQKQPKAH